MPPLRKETHDRFKTCIHNKKVHYPKSTDWLLMAIKWFTVNIYVLEKRIKICRWTRAMVERMNKHRIISGISLMTICWNSGLPHPSHSDEVWEWFCRSSQTVVINFTEERPPDYETLHTFIAEAARTVSNRVLVLVIANDFACLAIEPVGLLIQRSDSDGQVKATLSFYSLSCWTHRNNGEKVFWKLLAREHLLTFRLISTGWRDNC